MGNLLQFLGLNMDCVCTQNKEKQPGINKCEYRSDFLFNFGLFLHLAYTYFSYPWRFFLKTKMQYLASTTIFLRNIVVCFCHATRSPHFLALGKGWVLPRSANFPFYDVVLLVSLFAPRVEVAPAKQRACDRPLSVPSVLAVTAPYACTPICWSTTPPTAPGRITILFRS